MVQGRKQTAMPSVETVLGKRLPANLEAERSVLGALLLNDELAHSISEIIHPEDFYTPAHREIYQSILSILNNQKRVDILTLQDDLTKKDKLKAVGDISYLMSLQEDIPALGLVEQHAAIIKEKSVLRSLIQSATGIITSFKRVGHSSSLYSKCDYQLSRVD